MTAPSFDKMRRGNRYEVYRDKAGEWRWRLFANHRIVADSGEGYRHRGHAVRMAKRMELISKRGAAKILDIERREKVA